jgi:clan AA aspartic protease (TIGR02281 family)
MRSVNENLLQNYLSAFNDENIILSKYSHVCDSSEIKTRKDDSSNLVNITNVPKMEIIKPIDSKVSLSKDMAGMFNVPVIIDNDTVDFVFDTGASISVITKSLAEKMGIKILTGIDQVETSTGKTVKGEIGLLNFKLGNIKVKNSVFIVFPDSALSFGNGSYKIKGIIGFPIMYAFQEFIIKDNKFLIIPQKPELSDNRNFALDWWSSIVIMVVYKNDTLPFYFDSGANVTTLTSLFFNTYKKEIIRTCRTEKSTTEGVEGATESKIYIIDSINIAAGNSECQLDSLNISTKDLMGNYDKYQYGNLGQDYISKFSEMKVNFASMNISFSNKKK